jgi:GNAT superfamily N-acetyltransferase
MTSTPRASRRGTMRSMHLAPAPTFRAATLSDAAAIVALVEAGYRGDSGRLGWTTESDLLDGQRTDLAEVTDLISRSESRMLVADRGERLIACCHIERHGAACYFGMFSVDPVVQGGGTGRALLGEAERVARDEWGCHEVTMTVIDVRTELVEWYERRGYARTGEHKPFPYGNERFGVPKRPDLRFDVLRKLLGR